MTAHRSSVPDSAQHIAFVVNNYLPSVGGESSTSPRWPTSSPARCPGDRLLPGRHPVGAEANPRIVRFKCSPAVGGVLAWPWPGTSRKIRRMLADTSVTAFSTHTRFFPMSLIGVRLAKKLVAGIHTDTGPRRSRRLPRGGLRSNGQPDHRAAGVARRDRVLCISEGARDSSATSRGSYVRGLPLIDTAAIPVPGRRPEPGARGSSTSADRPGQGLDRPRDGEHLASTTRR